MNEGDFIITKPINTFKERRLFVKYVLWWAQYSGKVVKTQTVWVLGNEESPGGKAIKVTLTRNYRAKVR